MHPDIFIFRQLWLSTNGRLVLSNMDAIIRPYRPGDEQEIFDISADTAYFGDPVEAFLEDRSLYVDAFARYYLEHEADFAWVAESMSNVVGFLLGCVNTKRQSGRWRNTILTRVLPKAIIGKYKLGRRTARFALGMVSGALRGEGIPVDLHRYPAHLQINVKEGYRGIGLGRELMQAYLDQLKQLGVRGVYLETTSHNEVACHLYEKIGFELLGQHLNDYWSKRFGFQVYNRSYGLAL